MIITPGDPERFPLLEMPSAACQIPISSADEQAIVQMDAILDELDTEAAGLAAVQIGFPHRIFLLRNGFDSETDKVYNNAYINPEILSVSKAIKADGEACLSLPGMGARIKRPKSVTLGYFDLSGVWQTETFDGFWARAVMHEMDHLNGMMITHHLEDQLGNHVRRSSFGMKLTPHRQTVINKRRSKKRNARKQRKHLRAIGR